MLSEGQLKRWLREARAGKRSVKVIVEELRRLPFEDIGVARLDTHRRLRRGIPEVVFCEGKSPSQIIKIVEHLFKRPGLVLLTRLNAQTYTTIREKLEALHYDPIARLAFRKQGSKRRPSGSVAVITGGTSDLPVAEEAAITLELLGNRVTRLYDIGVAGIHRLLNQWKALTGSRVVVVIAGMDGALASVVGGLVRCPVIAVPTSVGYGAAYQGLAPLLTMLNSCSPGVGVVNIDNGFGAAYLAHTINRPNKG